MKKAKIVVFWVLWVLVSTANAQVHDPHFSQYMFNHASFNPGSVGSSDMVCVNGINRTQWIGFPGAPITTNFSANAAIKPFGIPSGVGFNAYQDVIGFNKNLNMSAAYAYRRTIGEGKLAIGLSLGFQNNTLDASKFILGDGANSASGNSGIPRGAEEKASVFDMNLGLYYNTEKVYFGLSSTHLYASSLKYEGSVIKFSRHYFMTSGYHYQLENPLFVVSPSFLLISDLAISNLDLSAVLTYNKRFWGGLSYRVGNGLFGNAIIGILGIELMDGVRFSYSYDLTTSAIGGYSGGSHEFYVGYCFGLDLNKIPQKYKSVRFL